MQTSHRIVSLILALLMVSSGLPLFSVEDANRDTLVGLDDAIIHIRDFTQTAEDPVAFTSTVEKMLAALHTVAKLKTVIKPQQDTKSTSLSFCLDLPYLISSYDGLTPSSLFTSLHDVSLPYQSMIITPASPPPEVL
jgi:hypothetical protein